LTALPPSVNIEAFVVFFCFPPQPHSLRQTLLFFFSEFGGGAPPPLSGFPGNLRSAPAVSQAVERPHTSGPLFRPVDRNVSSVPDFGFPNVRVPSLCGDALWRESLR